LNCGVNPKTKSLIAVAAFLVAASWAIFVWPTAWKEYKAGATNIRVNRITGTTETLSSFGWQADRQSTLKEIPPVYSGAPVDIPKLRQTLEAAGFDADTQIRNIRLGLRYHKYADALFLLENLKQTPGLKDTQEKVIEEVIEQVKQAVKNEEAGVR
jgi:hypothetical protein